ncbi:MAG: MFS transporter [Asgard group archaeon]|nr:MFS transporter [Asgard group archaeon]
MNTTSESLTDNMLNSSKPSVKQVLRNAPFMTLFSAQFIENVGRAISGLALEFLVYELTESPLMMGIMSIIWLLPFVIITPLAGVYTDRLDQRKIMFYSNVGSCIASIGFVIIYLLKNQLMVIETAQVLTAGGNTVVQLIHNPVHILWPLFILLFINSSSAAFFFPARSAYTRLIVEKKNLLVANSIGSTVFQIATIVGFVLAGILAAKSYLGSFIVDASTFFVSGVLIAVLFKIGKKPPEVERVKSTTFRGEVSGLFKDMRVGFRTIREHPKVFYILVVFTALMFSFGAINVLFIVILQGEMGLGQMWYGLIQGLMGASGIITAIILMSIGKIRRKIMLINIAFSLLTVTMYIFAVVRNKWVIASILFTYGIISVFINVPTSTLIQETIPYEKQGRVFGSQQLAQGFAQLVGMGIVSVIAQYVLPMYVLLGSSVLLTIVIITGFVVSGMKGLMKPDPIIDLEAEEEKEQDIVKTKPDSLVSSSASATAITHQEIE